MIEEWKIVPDWPEYEISNLGKIRHAISRARGAFKAGDLRIPDKKKWGHLRITLRSRDGRRANKGIHWLVLSAFVGPPPTSKHEPAHCNGNSKDNSLGNLRWATKSENEMDKIAAGTSNRGERQHMARLIADQVGAIRSSHASGRHSQSELAKQYGVHRSTIAAITQGRSWYWLPPSGPLDRAAE